MEGVPMSPESLLLLHHAAHAELLAEIQAGRPAGSRALRRAADALTRALAVRGSVRRRLELTGGAPAVCPTCA